MGIGKKPAWARPVAVWTPKKADVRPKKRRLEEAGARLTESQPARFLRTFRIVVCRGHLTVHMS